MAWPRASALLLVTEATMPPAWSPGVALAGTVSVNGMSARERAGTVTVVWASRIQPPTSVGGRSAGSRSKPPDVVLYASLP
ncbi:hypothetical protein AAFH96_36925 [Polymorphospora sp. 2-325]|uniref:Secreted protein n=1 Tax=Polymorphospora lycopeni TaxID=3140240 RepID=A0ABV5D2X5_9ACTN